jgi:hypothetical protein
MTVAEAIQLLSLMPQDAKLVGTDGPITPRDDRGSARLSVQQVNPILSGFNAEELRSEEWDLFTYEEEKLVVLAMTRNSLGREL